MISGTYEVIVGPNKRSAEVENYDDNPYQDSGDDLDAQDSEDDEDDEVGYEYKDSYDAESEPQVVLLESEPKDPKKYVDDLAPKEDPDIESESDTKQKQQP